MSQRRDPYRLILLLLLPMMCVVVIKARPSRACTSPRLVRSTLNPNDAPWWELTVLPEFGEKTARTVAAYRERFEGAADGRTARVFASPADLTKVRGIGPKTADRIAPFLRFP